MQRQQKIPNFNHSLTESRRSRTNRYELQMMEQQHDEGDVGRKKLFNDVRQGANDHTFRGGGEMWDMLYQEQNKQYQMLENKHRLLEESIALYREALSLKNSENIDNQFRLYNLQKKQMVTQQHQKCCQQKLLSLSHRCQQVKKETETIYHKINKEQSMYIQQDKHISQLQNRIKSIKYEIQGLQKQLSTIQNKQEEYENVKKKNQQLENVLKKINGEASFVKIRIEREVNQEENVGKKIKELQKIVKAKQKNIRELGKKLIQLKKVNPDIVAMAEAEKNGQKNLKLKEIINNIRQMEESSEKVQGQIYQITEKINILSQKVDQKVKTVEILRMKQRNQLQEQQNQRKKSTINYQNTGPKLTPKHIVESHAIQQNQGYEPHEMQKNYKQQPKISIQAPKKPLGYHVIQSQQNEHFVFPRPTLRQQTNEQNPSKSLQRSQNSQQLAPGYSDELSNNNRVQTSQQSAQLDNDDSILQINESLKNLVKKFYKYKSNSLFKH